MSTTLSPSRVLLTALTSPFARRADRAALRAAVASLDERVPDWRARLDVAALDMRSSTACVLGQLTRRYTLGITQLCPDHRWGDHVAACRAFDASFPVRLWRDELLRRPADLVDDDEVAA